MTKPPNKVQGNESELYPNARERFEQAVDVVIKSGPKHRQAPPLNQRNVQHLKGAFIKAGRELKRAMPFTRFKVSDFHLGLWMAARVG